MTVAEAPPTPSQEDIDFERSCAEIIADVQIGVVPRSVRTFSELHNHVDANEYGGATDDAHPHCADIDHWGRVQARVNAWLWKRGHLA